MSDLRGKSTPAKMHVGGSSKVFAAILVILGIGALAAYAYQTGQLHVTPKPVVTNHQLPTLPK